MSISKSKKEKLLSKVESLKQINDNPEKIFNVKNKYLDGSVKDVYGELIHVAESLILKSGANNSTVMDVIKNHSYFALDKTTVLLKNILLDSIRKSFFVGDGVCGTKKTLPSTIIRIKPREFDLFDMFRVKPESTVGKILYESRDDYLQKVNTEFYNIFSGGTYVMKTVNNDSLFEITWDATTQEYVVTLHQTDVRKFLDHYYSMISYPKLRDVLKKNLVYSLRDNSSTNGKTIMFDKVLDKIFSNCRRKKDERDNEDYAGVHVDFDEIDLSGMFEFDDVAGFTDEQRSSYTTYLTCYELDVPKRKETLDEFIYFESKGNDANVRGLIDDVMDKVALHDAIHSKYKLTIPNIKIAFLKDFLNNLPKSLLYSIFSPKYLFPIVVVYKLMQNRVGEVTMKELMTEFKKLFVTIITTIFWRYVNEFWSLLKNELIKTLKAITGRFLRNKLNRYLLIITSLINILKRIPKNKFDNCDSLYEMIAITIDTLLNTRNKISIPNTMLLLSDRLSGFSQDRALLNAVEELNSSGVSTSPIYGEENNLLKIMKSIINGQTTEMDQNGYIKVVLSGGVLPSGPGGTVIPPGVIGGVGKIF